MYTYEDVVGWLLCFSIHCLEFGVCQPHFSHAGKGWVGKLGRFIYGRPSSFAYIFFFSGVENLSFYVFGATKTKHGGRNVKIWRFHDATLRSIRGLEDMCFSFPYLSCHSGLCFDKRCCRPLLVFLSAGRKSVFRLARHRETEFGKETEWCLASVVMSLRRRLLATYASFC